MEEADSITLLLYTVALRVSHAVFTRETKKYDPIEYFVLRMALFHRNAFWGFPLLPLQTRITLSFTE
jgi:hypothetical protein